MLKRALLLILYASSSVHAASLAECRTIADDQQRLSCYDRLADSGIAQNSAQVRADSKPNNAEITQDLFGRADAQSSNAIKEVLGVEVGDQLEATLTRVDKGPRGKLLLTLDNQQQWAQVDNSQLRVRVGDRIRIERASFGSYMLEKADGSRAIRVKRID